MGSIEIRGSNRIASLWVAGQTIPLGEEGVGNRAAPRYVRGTLRGAWRGSEVWSPSGAAESMMPAGQLAKAWRNVGGPVVWRLRCPQKVAGRYGFAARSGRARRPRTGGTDCPGRQGRLLFAYLVRHRDRVCSRAELIDVLWPERPPAAADTALSALLSKLRRTLGDGVVGGRGGLRLALGGDRRRRRRARRGRGGGGRDRARARATGRRALARGRAVDRRRRRELPARLRRPAGCTSSAASSTRSACAAWRRSPRPGCARAGAISRRPSRPPARRSRWRRSASRPTSC